MMRHSKKSNQCFPVQGELVGQQINTTVDSQIARYYFESLLKSNKSDPKFDDRIEGILKEQQEQVLSRESLKRLSEKTSVDFASLYLAKKLLEDESNHIFYIKLKEQISKIESGMETNESYLISNSNSYICLFVPGWVYKSVPTNGADMAKAREIITKAGLENYLIEIEETGTVEENANYLAKEIIRYNHLNKNLILVSASSGSPVVLQAIGEFLQPSQLMNVIAWVNIGGILQGSPVADAAVRWPNRWLTKMHLFFRGWRYDSVESMTTAWSQNRFKRVNLPPHIFYLNYIGIPLSGQVTTRAKNRYSDLRVHGPNDGFTLIIDEIIPDGVTIVEFGLDHYYLDPKIDLKTVALAQLVINHRESLKH